MQEAIGAIAGGRFDSLASIFLAPTGGEVGDRQKPIVVVQAAEAVLELPRLEVFKKLPGYERFHTPISENLFKILQPWLNDALFLGNGYEQAFETFETLFALAVADLRSQVGFSASGPYGRFAWKRRSRHGTTSPFDHVVAEANALEENWGPVKAGLFSGKINRFREVAAIYGETLASLNWY